jgi:hypothetical protein
LDLHGLCSYVRKGATTGTTDDSMTAQTNGWSTGGGRHCAFGAIEIMRRTVVVVLTGGKARAPRTQSTAPLIVDLHPSREMVEDVNDSP